MKLKKIRANNYKGFKDLSLDIRSFNIIIGKNGSGKSTIARLIPFLVKCVSSEQEQIDFEPYGINIAGDFTDIVYGGIETRNVRFGLCFEGNNGDEYEVIFSLAYYNEVRLTKVQDFILTKNRSPVLNLEYRGDQEGPDIYEVNGDARRVLFNSAMPRYDSVLDFDQDSIYKEFIESLKGISGRIKYLAPFRKDASRFYPSMVSKPKDIGFDGAMAPYVLYFDDHSTKKVIGNVKKWMSDNFEGKYVDVQKRDYGFSLITTDGNSRNNIVDDGVGFGQLLPLIVNKYIEPYHDAIHIVEQPEIHLHPAACGSIIDLYIGSVDEGSIVIFESHSKQMVLRLRRRLVGASSERLKKFQIIYTEKRDSMCIVDYIFIDDKGATNWWPDGIFEDSYEEIMKIYEETRGSQ